MLFFLGSSGYRLVKIAAVAYFSSEPGCVQSSYGWLGFDLASLFEI